MNSETCTPTTRRHRIVLALGAFLLATGLALVAPSMASADGASYPDSAPTLTPGIHVTGGADVVDTYAICCHQWEEAGQPGVQYWKVPTKVGDLVTLDFEHIAGSSATGICVLPANTTDYTVGESDCIAEAETPDSNKAQLTYTAAGSKVLFAVYDENCCPDEAWAYGLVAHVKHRTTLTIRAPRTARKGDTIKLKGRIAPVVAGARLVLQVKSPAHGWVTEKARPRTDGSGAYTATYRLGHSGRHSFRIKFLGTSSYRASRATTTVSVR